MMHLLRKFDNHYIARLQGWSKNLRPLMIFASMSGSPVVTLSIAGGLIHVGLTRQYAPSVVYGLTIFFAITFDALLKWILRRQRPVTYIVPRWAFFTFSFPSGHATGAMSAYGALALIIMTTITWPLNFIIALSTFSWIVLVGMSRVYLGAHYPSDVVIGWLLGVGCLIVVQLL